MTREDLLNSEHYLQQVCINCAKLKKGILLSDPKYKCLKHNIQIRYPLIESCNSFMLDYTKIKTQ